MKPVTDPKDAHEAASLWAARLDGAELTATQRRALGAWLEEDPAHRTLLASYCQLSADLEQQLAALPTSLTIPSATASPAPKRWKTFTRRAALASVGIAAAVAFLTVWPRESPEAVRLATNIGERLQQTLTDGSRLELNSQSAVVVDFSATERRVRLASGQAFFSVRRDAARPFIVETPQGAVRVTGTAFDVRAAADDPLEVTVAEGTVQVSAHDAAGGSRAPVEVRAGQRFTGQPGAARVEPISASALSDVLAWREGQIVFEGVALREAVRRFGRHHGRSVTVAAGAADFPVGGRYSLDDFDGFLAALEEIFPVEVTHSLNGTTQVRLRPQP